jgi:putative aldouronate transport system permease protein
MVKGKQDKKFDASVIIILLIIVAICVLPLLYVVSVSLTPITEVLKNGGFVIIPKKITLVAYRELFSQRLLPTAMNVTLFITVLGTIIDMIFTTLMAYPLSRKKLAGRKMFMYFIIFTMMFSGGMIPTYLLVRSLHLTNTYLSMILPGAVSTFNLLVMKSFFENLPEELFESARIDGAKEFYILLRIVVPLSMPVFVTIALFCMVGHWNTYISAILYITNTDMYPLQVVLRNLLLASTNTLNADETVPTQTFQMASVVFASIPIIAVYPFIQKYFVSGMMLGAVKG